MMRAMHRERIVMRMSTNRMCALVDGLIWIKYAANDPTIGRLTRTD